LLAAIAAMVLASALMERGPERVLEAGAWPDSQLWDVVAGEALVARQSHGGRRIRVYALPVEGGPERLIGQDDSSGRGVRLLGRDGGDLYYVLEDNTAVGRERPLIRRLRLGGGAPETVTLPVEHPEGQFAPSGGSLFWIEAGLGRRQIVQDAYGRVATLVRRHTLRIRRPDGVTLTLGTREAGWSQVEADGRGGAFWSVGSRRDGVCEMLAASAQGTLRPLGAFTGLASPVRAGDRLYWLSSLYPRQPGRLPVGVTRMDLMEMAEDGSHQRAVLNLVSPGHTRPLLHGLRAHAGRLYAIEIVPGPSRDAPSIGRSAWLCTLHPERHDVVERLCRLPAGAEGRGWIDQGCYYFLVAEDRENWLDWSAEGLFPRRVAVLYRHRLD